MKYLLSIAVSIFFIISGCSAETVSFQDDEPGHIPSTIQYDFGNDGVEKIIQQTETTNFIIENIFQFENGKLIYVQSSIDRIVYDSQFSIIDAIDIATAKWDVIEGKMILKEGSVKDIPEGCKFNYISEAARLAGLIKSQRESR